MLEGVHPFKQRLIMSSAVSIFLFLAIFLAPLPFFKPVFAAIVAGSVGLAIWELYHIASAKGLRPAKWLGIVLGVLYVFAVAVSTQYTTMHVLPEVVLWLGLFVCSVYYFKGNSPLMNLSATMFGVVYLAIPLSCMLRVIYFFGDQGLEDGRWWLFYLISVAKMTDTGGFFIGKWIGKHQLAPYISPKKTWEGAIGGFVLAILTSFVVIFTAQYLDARFSITLLQSLFLSTLIAVLAQFGDLIESLLKRDAGIKDSNDFPGLGGMLDMVDSLVFTAPLVYLFLEIYK